MKESDVFERAVKFVLRPDIEGVHSNDQDDPGGDTWYGISRVYNPEFYSQTPTRERAVEWYRVNRWDKYRLSELPAPVAFMMFDDIVNHNPVNSIKTLQLALQVNVDGVIGDVTVKAAWPYLNSDLQELFARRMFAYGNNVTGFKTFGLGWSRRLVACYIEAAKETV